MRAGAILAGVARYHGFVLFREDFPQAAQRDAPLSMDRASRNQRLYDALLALGLYVVPMKSREERGGIEYMIVATAPPRPEVCFPPG